MESHLIDIKLMRTCNEIQECERNILAESAIVYVDASIFYDGFLHGLNSFMYLMHFIDDFFDMIG